MVSEIFYDLKTVYYTHTYLYMCIYVFVIVYYCMYVYVLPRFLDFCSIIWTVPAGIYLIKASPKPENSTSV